MQFLGRLGTASALFRVPRRLAGGGGRPGAKPAFSWKERKALNLPEVNAPLFKPPVRGEFAEVANLVGESTENMQNLLDLPDGVLVEENIVNARKVIHPSNLFGPGKPRGKISKKYNYNRVNFSHSRIFGRNRKNTASDGDN